MRDVSQRKRKENSCFNYEKRLLLEGYLLGKQGYPKITQRKALAHILGCDRKTVYNEIKRGLVQYMKTELRTVAEYNADYAHQDSDWQNTARDRSLKNRHRFSVVRSHTAAYSRKAL